MTVMCYHYRVLNVTGAGYADCSGLYAISNMTSIWDSKRVVFERIAGGWRPMDKRYIVQIYVNTLYIVGTLYVGTFTGTPTSSGRVSTGGALETGSPWWKADPSTPRYCTVL